MKKILLALFFSTTLFADDPACEPPPYPFGLSGLFLNVGDARISTPEFRAQDLHYTQNNAAFAYTHPCNPFWGLIFGAGWVGTEVKWKENPFFHETQFDYVTLSLGAFTRSMSLWTWAITGTMFIDTAVLDLGNFTLYQGVFTGKYEFSPCLLIDVGFLLEVGLNKGKIWPVLGFEWDATDRLSFNIVYPIDISVEYELFRTVTLAASLRFLRDRHRVLDTEPLPMGIYEYQTTGAEFDVVFTPIDRFTLIGFVGSTVPGRLKLTDQNNHNPLFVEFKGSFYSGLSAILAY